MPVRKELVTPKSVHLQYMPAFVRAFVRTYVVVLVVILICVFDPVCVTSGVRGVIYSVVHPSSRSEHVCRYVQASTMPYYLKESQPIVCVFGSLLSCYSVTEIIPIRKSGWWLWLCCCCSFSESINMIQTSHTFNSSDPVEFMC